LNLLIYKILIIYLDIMKVSKMSNELIREKISLCAVCISLFICFTSTVLCFASTVFADCIDFRTPGRILFGVLVLGWISLISYAWFAFSRTEHEEKEEEK